MENIDQVESEIRSAVANFKNCPICGAPVLPDPVGGSADGSVSYAHDCECLMELCMARTMFAEDNFFEDFPDQIKQGDNIQGGQYLTAKYLFGLKKVYKKWCHNCKRDGVDSKLSECEPDPPYMFKCRYCNQSLRSHPSLGEGMIRDMATSKGT